MGGEKIRIYDGSGGPLVTTTTADLQGRFVIDLGSVFTPGVHEVIATAESQPSLPAALTIAPVIAAPMAPSIDAIVSPMVIDPMPVTGTCMSGTTDVLVYVDGASPVSAVVIIGTTWSASIPGADLGDHTITATASNAGGVSPLSAPVSVTIARVAPSIDSPLDGARVLLPTTDLSGTCPYPRTGETIVIMRSTISGATGDATEIASVMATTGWTVPAVPLT